MSGHYEKIFQWPDEAVAVMRRMWSEEGASASLIANALTEKFCARVTRNAVIGKVNRLGFSKPEKKVSLARRTKKSAARRPLPVVKQSLTPAAPIVVAPLPVDPIAENSALISLSDLREATCRFPIGDPRDEGFGFCGAPSPLVGSPYCAFHHRIAYVPQQKAALRKSTDPRGMRQIQMTAF